MIVLPDIILYLIFLPCEWFNRRKRKPNEYDNYRVFPEVSGPRFTEIELNQFK
jgi:hypothetical protein